MVLYLQCECYRFAKTGPGQTQLMRDAQVAQGQAIPYVREDGQYERKAGGKEDDRLAVSALSSRSSAVSPYQERRRSSPCSRGSVS